MAFTEPPLYAWPVGECRTSIATSRQSLHWGIFLPPPLSFLSLSQKKLNIFVGSFPPLGWRKDAGGPPVYTWLMTNLIDHMPCFNGGHSHCQRRVCASAWMLSGSFCTRLGPHHPFLFAWGNQSCHPLSFLPHASLAWVLSLPWVRRSTAA